MPTLNDVLDSLTVTELKELLPYVPNEKGGSRKAEVIQRIRNGLVGDATGGKLKQQYELLDQWQQQAVAEALYDPRGQFFPDEFKAKYQKLPVFKAKLAGKTNRYNTLQPTRLCLFLFNTINTHRNAYGIFLPQELMPLLLKFVPKPAPVQLPTLKALPETDNGNALLVRLCEQEVLTDLPQVLNLAQQGKLKASAKTGRASAATIKLLAESLSGGDFYDPNRPKAYSWSQEIGGIKSFAWPLLLQAAKLAQISGSKLELSRTGTRQVAKPSAETLRLLWQKWQNSKLLDEFRRVEAIKGQNSKGRVMTAIASRRLEVEDALQQCPVGEWVGVDSFFNFMQAAKFHFEITHNPWKLYLGDREYGSFGYSGYAKWELLQGRYVLCLLFEYAATLGMVDVAYVDPEDARDDYRGNWGADDLDFLSRYDGLRYFRLTTLGAYCLGLTNDYEAPTQTSDCGFSILPSLHINLVSGIPTAEDQLILDTWASQEADNSWKLDKAKTILAMERGMDIDVLQNFLQAGDDQPLPEAVEGFINTCRKQGRAIKQVAVSLLLECSSEAIAETLAEHKETRRLCQRVGKKQLVVKQSQEEKFRQAARVVGFGMVL